MNVGDFIEGDPEHNELLEDLRRNNVAEMLHIDRRRDRREMRMMHADNQRRRRIREEVNIPSVFENQEPCKCEICDTEILCKVFLVHFEECARINNATNDLKSMTLHKYNSSDYVLLEFLHNLRYNCEVEYYETFLEMGRIFAMTCSGCPTFGDHVNGKCLTENMNNVFRMQAELFGAKILAHFEQYLYMKKQRGLEKILDKHNAYYDSIEECFTDETAADQETENRRQFMWFEFRKNTIDQQAAEKNSYIAEANAQMKKSYDGKKTAVDFKIREVLVRMKRSIVLNKRVRNNETMRQMVATARGAVNRLPEIRRERRIREQLEQGAIADNVNVMDADEEEIALRRNQQA